MDFAKLKTLLASEPYAAMSDEEAYIAINAATVTVVYSRFVSYRTLMNELTPTDYRTVKAAFAAAAASDVLLADADHAMQPAAGGIDFGSDNARAMIDAVFTGDLAPYAATLKGLAERKISPAQAEGITVVVTVSDIEIARGTRTLVQQEPAHA